MLTSYLKQVIRGEGLSSERMAEAVGLILEGVSPLQAAGFLAALQTRGVAAGELVGAVRAMAGRALKVEIPGPLYDIVGPGGDGAGLVNISTPSAMVASACGLRVAKHGNRALSSRCGAADLLEQLGLPIDSGPDEVARSVEQLGIAFLFAPRYHPAFAGVQEVRRSLRIPSLFNLVGPLLNPAGADHLLLGVHTQALLELYVEAVAQLPVERALIFCGCSCDELTPVGPSPAFLVAEGRVTSLTLDPAEVGCRPCLLSDLQGGEALYNGRQVERALQGEQGPLADAMALTVGAALLLGGEESFAGGVERARRALAEGRGWEQLKRWRAWAVS